MTDDSTLAPLLARIEQLEARATRAEERAARLEEAQTGAAQTQAPAAAPVATRAVVGVGTSASGPAGAPSVHRSRAGFLRTGITAAGAAAASVLALQLKQPPTAEAATSGLPVYNVRDYGAAGNGSADDTAAINAAILDAATAGGGVVYVPAGTYRVAPSPHPRDAAYAACVVMRPTVVLRGAGMGASTICLADHAPLPAGSQAIFLLLNLGIRPDAGLPLDEQMVVEDLTFDGRAATQSVPVNGVFWIRGRDVHHARVRVQNLYGTGNNSGATETFFFEFQLGAEAFYSGCEAVTTDASSSASGFSADAATGLTYEGCVAHGLKVGNGFTHYGCAALRYVNCHSYANGWYGFNSEKSEDVRYTGCVAGGRADPSGGGAFTANQPLGNTNAGFMVNNSRVVDLTACSSRYNGGNGLWLGKEPDGVRVCGGEFSDNGGWGIEEADGTTNLSISHETRLTGNALGALQARGDVNATTPFLYDSGWIAATTPTLTVDHGLPDRPRFVTLYVGSSAVPDGTTVVHTFVGPVYASATQISAQDLATGNTYRFVALF